MKIYDKVKWFLGIFLVFFLILATNLVDKENFKRIKDSVETTYEDRLIAQGMILEISEIIQKKEIAVVEGEENFFKKENKDLNQTLDNIVDSYLATKLTKEEERVFGEFQENLDGLISLERDATQLLKNNKEKYRQVLHSSKSNLKELADIQIQEGRRQTMLSKEVMETVEFFSQVEIYFLLTLAILVQIIVIYNPGKEPTEE